MKRILLLAVGIVGVLVGLGFIMPAVSKWQAQGLGGSDVMPPLLIGSLLVLGALFALVKGAVRSRA